MSQTINLGVKHQKQIQQQFTIGSLLQGRLENDIDFVGAKTVRVHTINTAPMQNYDRTKTANRYGTPEEVGDSVQELFMTQDKSFTSTIDKGNNLEQAINKAGKFLRVQLDEQVIPMMDAYGFKMLAHKAGKISASATALDKTNVLTRMNAARSYMLNKRVPQKGRTWFMRSEVYDALCQCESFINLESLGGKTVATGQVGELFGAPVVEVPQDLMPQGVNFMLVHKSAASSPSKISDTKVHIDPPGISGSLIEGRFYWDTFVFGAKADGVYADIDTSTGVSVLAKLTVNASTGAITGVTGGAVVKFTTDGSNPRYSFSAQTGTAPVCKKGDTVRAYQYKADDDLTFESEVAEVKIA